MVRHITAKLLKTNARGKKKSQNNKGQERTYYIWGNNDKHDKHDVSDDH